MWCFSGLDGEGGGSHALVQLPELSGCGMRGGEGSREMRANTRMRLTGGVPWDNTPPFLEALR